MATTSNSSTDYQEDLFQAIDTIVQARIADLPYDKTLECKVIDISNAAKNIYKVEYENAKFEAISTIKNLAKNDIVYVQVPQGDFRKTKFIVALKNKSDTQNIKTLPFLSFIKGGNLFTTLQANSKYNVNINSNKNADTQFIFTSFYNEELAYGYTRMGVKASMLSNINNTLISGDYGIKITIYGYDQKQITYDSESALNTARGFYLNNIPDPRFYKEFTLTKADMVSTNLYNTHGYQNQEKVFDISGWVIDNIVVSLWQDNNFKDINGNRIEGKQIEFTGLSLYLGYDINEFKISRYSQYNKYDNYLDNLEERFSEEAKRQSWNNSSAQSQYLNNLAALMENYVKSLSLGAAEEAQIINAITKRYSSNFGGIFKTRIRTKDGMLYDKPDGYNRMNKTFELYALSINLDNNTYSDISNTISNIFCGIEKYNPIATGISLQSGEQEFEYYQTYWIRTSLNHFEGTIDLLSNGELLDENKNGILALLFNRTSNNINSGYNPQNEINAILNDATTIYYPSNKLWFVHKNRASLLTELLNSSISTVDTDIMIMPGTLIYSGQELLFKASDGTVLIRLNTSNSQFNGNAESASNYKTNGNIYQNFEKIQQAIQALGGHYDIV